MRILYVLLNASFSKEVDQQTISKADWLYPGLKKHFDGNMLCASQNLPVLELK